MDLRGFLQEIGLIRVPTSIWEEARIGGVRLPAGDTLIIVILAIHLPKFIAVGISLKTGFPSVASGIEHVGGWSS